ncbi:MAG: amidohydrolase family protein [candidate division KSB1 bacterium]|nr:amidohydrolase family protein [candidate division KSB1 bacterium]MDZ7336838.1 amidohydrolase family protein [candidate division KSB1 bacterium]MDZ7358791.1 amidohydrolase family protein [candidate division KSB1 bacterium]MDZ7399005.1 amidohydrolase family protein [candidate division KSB1 bacterium]
MAQLKYIDCYAAVGKWTGKDFEAPWTIDQMLSDMERCLIHGALVYTHLARELQPSVGNQMVLDICHRFPRLIPCWVVLPHQCDEAPPGPKLVQEMLEKGVKAAKLFPKLHRFPLKDPVMDLLFNSLQDAGIPVIFDRGEHEPEAQQIDWDDIHWICTNYPRLNVILHGVRWEATRHLLPLLKRFPHLYCEFSNHQGNRIIEFLVKEIGADQLLFGTQMMQKSPGAAKAFIDYADISLEHRKKIAHENLARLLKLQYLPDDYPDDRNSDKILQQVRSAKPIADMEVIDSHAHISEKGHSDIVIAPMPEADAAGLVERNRRIGVDITCVSSWTGIWNDYERGNEIVYQAIQDFPEHIVGYATLDPNYVLDWDLEIQRCHQTYGMKGMKPYFPRNKVPYNDQRYRTWFSYGNQHRLFALMHFSDNFVKEMEELAAMYPEISFLLAHSGMSYETARKHVALAKQFPNIFLEITYTAVTNGVIEYMVREVGSERVIYGSDAVMRDPIPQFGWLAYSNISEADKRNILGKNMRRIIDRCI